MTREVSGPISASLQCTGKIPGRSLSFGLLFTAKLVYRAVSRMSHYSQLVYRVVSHISHISHSAQLVYRAVSHISHTAQLDDRTLQITSKKKGSL